jgi:uncharacterized protein YpmB
MIPGSVSKLTEATMASASAITAKTDIVNLTGTTAVQQIVPGLGAAQSQFLVLVPKDGSVVLGTSGNIAVGITALQNRAVFLVYVRTLGKWVINSGV